MAKIGIAPVFAFAVIMAASSIGCGATLYREHTFDSPTHNVIVSQTRSRYGDVKDIQRIESKTDALFGFGPYGSGSAYGAGIIAVPSGMPASGGARAMETHGGLGSGIFPYGLGVSAIVMPPGTVDHQARAVILAQQQVLLDLATQLP